MRTSWLDGDRHFTGEVVSKGSSRIWELRHEESQEILGLRSEMLPHPKEMGMGEGGTLGSCLEMFVRGGRRAGVLEDSSR